MAQERGIRGSVDAADTKLVFGPWCTLTGGFVFTTVLFTWRSSRWVFFDQICIHQYDQDLKFKGIVSIGAFLKYSQNFLLVWDETFAGRMWCMLELAAFLTSHEDLQGKVYIRPTAMAPCILAIALALWVSRKANYILLIVWKHRLISSMFTLGGSHVNLSVQTLG